MLLQIVLGCLALVPIYFIYLYIRWNILYYTEKAKGIPIGSAHFIHPAFPFAEYLGKPTPLETERIIFETSKKYNTPFVKQIIGFYVSISVCDYQIIHDICIKKSKSFIKPVEVYDLLDAFGPNVLTTTGEEWKHQRLLFNPVFSQDAYLGFVCNATAKFTNQLMNEKLTNEENELCLKQPFTALALDVLSSSIFGIEAKALNPMDIKDYKEGEIPKNVSMTIVDSLMNIISGLVVNLLLTKRIARNIPFGQFKKQSKSVDDFMAYGKFMLEKGLLKQIDDNSQDALIQMMLKARDAEDSEFKLSDEELISNMFIFFFAGHETTAGTLHWAMQCLASNPKVQEKLFQEVYGVLKGRDPVYEDFKKLKYAFCVFKETLRLHAPVKLTVKKNIEKVTLGDVEFPKNTQFGLFFPGVHKSEKLWENPLEFNPDRFMDSYNPSHLMAFSYGKRNCIGSKFAEVEGTIILCCLIQKYSIHFKEGIDVKKYEDEIQFVTTLPRFDLPFVLKKRKIQ
eukprot:gene9194-1280_t